MPSLRALIFLSLCLTAPTGLAAQEAFLGLFGGNTAAPLPNEQYFLGANLGGFFQTDLSDHLGFRTEAGWLRTAADRGLSTFSGPQEGHVEVDFLTLNLMGRLSVRGSTLTPMASRLVFSTFGGGWLGYRLRRRDHLPRPPRGDFGHLVGVGVGFEAGDLLFQIDARWYHGEVNLWKEGPTQRGSQLVAGFGYRIHQ